jgi:hypothetical protein
MGTKGGQNWYQSIPYDSLSCRQVSFTLPQGTPSREEHKTFSAALVLFDTIPTGWVTWVNNIPQRPNIFENFLLQHQLALKNLNN